MGQHTNDHPEKGDCQMAEYQMTFLSGEIEGIEETIEGIDELDIPDEFKELIENWLEAKKKELRLKRTKLI